MTVERSRVSQMPSNHPILDYEPLTKGRGKRPFDGDPHESIIRVQDENFTDHGGSSSNTVTLSSEQESAPTKRFSGTFSILKHGHTISYVGLFLFTFVLYFRPYELFPALSSFSNSAYWLAIITLLIFLPSQFILEGTLTARPREVSLILLLCLAGLLSIPGAINPKEAWDEFNDVFIKAVLMFIVMINVVRTERRMKWIIYLALGVSVLLSINAIGDYRAGNFTVEGYRVKGLLGGMFGNPNDMAIHLVTMVPLAIIFMKISRNIFSKFFFISCAVLVVAADVVTFSRGGFLGLMMVAAVLIWKLGRSNRIIVTLFGSLSLLLFIVLAPGNYGLRILSIFIPSLDPVGSSTMRRAILDRSIQVSLRHPLAGVGMGNFHTVSLHETVTHNAYTQVSAEMGIAALVIYMMFMLAPLKKLRRIERETFAQRRESDYYYLAVGLQASILGYMVSSFFGAIAYQWYIYYLVAYAVCLRRIYAADPSATGESIASAKGLTTEYGLAAGDQRQQAVAL